MMGAARAQGLLLARTNSPVVVLNRAVALAEEEGAEAALSAIAPLADDNPRWPR